MVGYTVMTTLWVESYKTKSIKMSSIHLIDEMTIAPNVPAEDVTVAMVSKKQKDSSTMEVLQMLLSRVEHLETSLGDRASARTPQV